MTVGTDHWISSGILSVRGVTSALPLPASFYRDSFASTLAAEDMGLQTMDISRARFTKNVQLETAECHEHAHNRPLRSIAHVRPLRTLYK